MAPPIGTLTPVPAVSSCPRDTSAARLGASVALAMKFAITIVSPPGYLHSEAFREVAETIDYGLASLGHDSLITTEGYLDGRQHIVLGSNLLPAHPITLSPDAILYNLEQIKGNPIALSRSIIEIFKRHTVWDYSPANAAALSELGVTVKRILPIGYTKQHTRIKRAPALDIDVLFVGSMNARRKTIIEAMRISGLNAVTAFGVYGAERDALIARSKVLLNMHYYDAKIFEIVRISYYLANKCTVLSERSASQIDDSAFDGGIVFSDYGGLTGKARELCEKPALRRSVALRGFEIMKTRKIEKFLSEALQPHACG
jgi:hypothetical protein